MYSIGEISKIVKISVDTLRYYDEIGILKPYRIDKINRYRYYSEEQIKDILLIMELKQYGFSLDAIKELLQCKDPNRLKEAFNTRLHQCSNELSCIEKSIKLLKRRIMELEGSGNNMDNKTILIIDDSEFIRNIMKDFLEKHGYIIVGEAINGSEGLNKYIELKPDIVIMDINMPDLNGINATKMIKEKDSNAKILMCSAMGFLPSILKSLEAGACDFIAKPFYANNMIETIMKISSESCCYSSGTIEALLMDDRFNIQNENEPALSQQSINKLLSICQGEYDGNSTEVLEFYNDCRY